MQGVREMAATQDSLLQPADSALPAIFALPSKPLTAAQGSKVCQWVRKMLARGKPVVIHGCPMFCPIDLTPEGLSILRSDMNTVIEVQGELHSYNRLAAVLTV